MDAVQVMRARANSAGNLKSNDQVKVVTESQTIIVEPGQTLRSFTFPHTIRGSCMARRWSCGLAGIHIPGCTLRAPAFLSAWGSRSGCSLVSLGDRTAGDAIGDTEPLSSITTHSFRTARLSMAGTKDSMILERHAAMKESTALVPVVGMKDPTAPGLGAGTKDRAAETFVATEFTAARPSVGLQSRAPELVRILAPSVGMTTVAPRAAIRIEATRACTAAAFTKVASAAAVN
jgi:Protein of unknown function (DUF3300)